MEKIIVPTDFSENSMKALTFAFDVFQEDSVEFILCHVYDVPRGGTSTLFMLMEEVRKQAEIDMKELVKLIEEKYGAALPSVSTHVVQGNLEEKIKELAKTVDADLIVMGTKGASGVKEVLLGSNASAMLKSSPVPLFTIPENYSKKRLRKIILSYDGREIRNKVAKTISDLSKLRKLPIEVVHIRSEDESPIQNWREVDALFPEFSLSLKELYGKSFEEGLLSHQEELDGILVLIRREKSFWDQLLNKSNTRKAVLRIDVPILTIAE